MKVTVSQENLKKATALTEKVVSKNTSLPILNNILLKTENGRLKLSATNLEIGINTIIGVKIEEMGEIAVPARILSDFISHITDDKIILTTKNNTLFVNSENYKTQILGFDPKDFPIIPKIKNEPVASIPAKLLRNTLITVLDSVAVSETRPELAGVYIQVKNNQAILASTDSFRLTETKMLFKNSEAFSTILPRNTVTELIRVAWDTTGDIQIRYADNQIAFSNDDFEMISRVVDGNYPDYKRVIPDKFLSRALVKKHDLEKNIRLAGLFASNIADIKIQCGEQHMKIAAKNSDKGEIETTVPVLLRNDPFEVSLNYKYFLDGLKNINTEDVIIEFTGVGSPLVIKPSEDDSMVYIIMPLRN